MILYVQKTVVSSGAHPTTEPTNQSLYIFMSADPNKTVSTAAGTIKNHISSTNLRPENVSFVSGFFLTN